MRVYKERLKEQGRAGLFDRPICGRPAVTTQAPVEPALIQVVLAAVIEEHALPDDGVLAERVNPALHESQATEASQVTASMIETLRLRWGIQRSPLQQAIHAASTPTTAPEPVLATNGETLKGLYAGNPNRATDRPTAERLLKAFDDITLYHRNANFSRPSTG